MKFKKIRRATVVAALLGAALSLPVHAQFATGGSGLYRNNILWFDWGTAPGTIPDAGLSKTNTLTVAGQPLAVTCNLSGITGTSTSPQVDIYRPGGYFEDGLDYLYNIGGAGTANTMDIGLRTGSYGSSANFTFSCSATLGGSAYPLSGLVFADAETTSDSESTVVTPPAGATMRVIERLRGPGCDEPYYVDFNGTSYTFRTGLAPNSGDGGNSCSLTGDPAAMAVAYLESATSATVRINGGGQQAVALGVMLSVADYGDAPASYGTAGHLPQFTWSGGTLVSGTNTIYPATTATPAFALATPVQPSTALLGVRVDVEPSPFASASATLDDSNSTTGTNDEDGVNLAALAPLTRILAGQTYQVPVSCVGTAPVAGWIDFDLSGSFDTDERSVTVNCSGGSAVLSWTVNADVAAGQSYLRVRTAVSAADIVNPTGIASSGEVEDYAITIYDPKIRLAKISLGGVGGPFAFSTTNTTAQPAALSTATVGTAVVGTPVSITAISSSVVVTETSLPTGWVVSAISCTNAGTGPVLAPTYDLANRRATIPSSSLALTADITCTFTNTKQAVLRLQKALPGGRLVGTDQFALTIAGTGGPVTTTTTGSTTAPTEIATLNPATIGSAYTLSEAGAAGGSLTDYNTTYSCTNTLAGGQTPGGNGVSFTLTPVAGDDLTCILSNMTIPRADLSIVKTAVPTSVQTGGTITFTLVVSNNGPSAANGAVLRDAPGAGLNCSTPSTAGCSASAGAACPSATVPVASLLGSGGVTIPTLPAGGQVVVTLQCLVTATGLP